MDEHEETNDSIAHLDDPDVWKPVLGDPTAEFDATVTLRTALHAAVDTIVEVAEGGGTRLRFDASKYIVERILGKPTDSGADNPWEKMLDVLNGKAPSEDQ